MGTLTPIKGEQLAQGHSILRQMLASLADREALALKQLLMPQNPAKGP